MGDLVALEQALAAHRPIGAASYRQMTTPGTLADGSKTGYGFGVAIGALDGHRRIGHGGGINGFLAQLDDYPDDSLIVVVIAKAGSFALSQGGMVQTAKRVE